MLVQFMVKNVLSFKKETVLDMTAINAYKEYEYNLIKFSPKEKLLKVAAVYGANASGKSNLCTAMQLFQRIIRESFNNVDRGEENAINKYFVPFSFDKDMENSEFQIIEIIDGFEYKYGFEYNAECIVSEWMYRKNIKTNRTSIIFERSKEFIEFGAAVRKECDLYKNQVPSETLALSFFNKLKLKVGIFTEFFSAIMDTLVIPSDLSDDTRMLNKFLPQVIDSEKDKLIEFLMAIDTGIKEINYNSSENKVEFFTTHIGEDGEEYNLDLYMESEGTIRSIMIYINARVAILGNKSMLVDELNVKLHPLLLKFIIDLFYDEKSTAQLIYTTHDTTLLDKRFFRRDQIWFVQKDEFGHSELNALSDFKVRSDASFEKDYLAGVYGGIPFIKDFSMREGE